MDIVGTSAAYGGRLDWVRGLVEKRLHALGSTGRGLEIPAWKQGPAFELHIRSGLAEVLADPVGWMALRYIVVHGQEAHVVVFLHEPFDEVYVQLAVRSTRLASELRKGRSLRMAGCQSASGSGPRTEDPYGNPRTAPTPAREDEQVPADPEPAAPVPTAPATGGDPPGGNSGE